MTSRAIRDPLADHLITPQNAAFVFIDYQREQLATVRSMDHDLLIKNAVSTVRTVNAFRRAAGPLDGERGLGSGGADAARARGALEG
jgi:hypothetical protein